MEAIVIGLAIPVAIKLEHAPSGEAVTAGVVLAVAAVLLAAAARRGPLRLLRADRSYGKAIGFRLSLIHI